MHLYFHVPFCGRRCSYCDFAIAVRRVTPSREYGEVVLTEWAMRQDEPVWTGAGEVETVYFGGGTPSRLDPTDLSALLERVRHDRPLSPDAEITLEANPEDVTAARAAAWRLAGVNRVSLGVQSFDLAVLRWMHREHGAAEIEAAVPVLRAAGIDNVSLDLIFALPRSLGRDWSRDVERALSLEPAHLSLYGLTVEPHTALGRWTERGEAVPAEEGPAADEFLEAHETMARHGFEHYEVSNFSVAGRRSRHNSAYWRRRPYQGFGPSAHSGSGALRRWNIREWEAYRTAVVAGRQPLADSEALSPAQVALEDLYLGLRTLDGVPVADIPGLQVSEWVAAGWASVAGGRVRLSVEGWLRLDALVAGVRRA
ncbi:MAG: radical SAM family heme chaperone HemW [Gemmatimonadota bacterium]